MKHTFTATIAPVLLLLGTMDAACAERRAPLSGSTDEPKTAGERRTQARMEMDAWLRRLIGRYYRFDRIAIDGTLKDSFGGKGPDGAMANSLIDCVGIGSGPGVLCTWYSVLHKPGREDSYRLTMLVEFGLDPNASKIRILMAMTDGSIGESSAVLSDDAASWLGMSCRSAPIKECQRTMKISAPSDGKYIVWSYGFRRDTTTAGRKSKSGGSVTRGSGENYMYRLRPDEGNGPDGLPRAMPTPILDIEPRQFDRPTGPR